METSKLANFVTNDSNDNFDFAWNDIEFVN